jgi:tRNA threonylcarbamoyladenosine biosynthesis protein TsaE
VSPDPEPYRRDFATPQALEAFGAAIAARLEPGEAVCLDGPLGAGKTTLARGLVRALMGEDGIEVPSATFTLVQLYAAPRLPLAHLDLYRLTRPEEAFELGLDEALDGGAAVIEWSERLAGQLPGERLEVVLAAVAVDAAEGRRAAWRGFGRWRDKAHALAA